MLEHTKSERSGPAVDGLELLSHTLSITVECYRSFEYYLQWRKPMYRRRSATRPSAPPRSPPTSPSPDEEVIQRRLKGRRRGAAAAAAAAAAGSRPRRGGAVGVQTRRGRGRGRDIIDIIECSEGGADVDVDVDVGGGEGDGPLVEVADEGVEGSDEDSLASGPSILCNPTPRTAAPRPLQGLCSACRQLYQRVKRMKAPRKSKLLDNDPKSLTCDQWVLMKSVRPGRQPDGRGRILTHVQLIKRGLIRRGERHGRAEASPAAACWRPHAFLQRNLRRHARVPAKKQRRKESRRKRGREGSEGPRAAKQRRLQGDDRRRRRRTSSSLDDADRGPSCSSGPRFDDSASDESISSPASVETSPAREEEPKGKAPKKAGGFRDLLSKLRGNCSMIVREKR